MEELRAYVQKYVSQSTIALLIVASVGTLGIVSVSYMHQAENLLSEADSDATPYMHVNAASVAISYNNLRSLVHSPAFDTAVPDRSFAAGESSKEVLQFQEFLQALGYLPHSVEVNGYFGGATIAALRKYQLAHHITPESIVGPETRSAWKSDIATVL